LAFQIFVHDVTVVTCDNFIMQTLTPNPKVTTINLQSGVMCSKRHHLRHCMVLPPGEFSGVILEPLSFYCESFNRLSVCSSSNKHKTHRKRKTIPHPRLPTGVIRAVNVQHLTFRLQSNYSATSMLIHWLLMGGLLHLVQR